MKEEVPEAPSEGYRIRQFSLFYFLVDDSLRVSEMKQVPFPLLCELISSSQQGLVKCELTISGSHLQENSGLAQGTFLKRHRVPRTDGDKAPGRPQFMTWEDLKVGEEVTIYSRKMIIVDCDAFTREFYALKGIEQPPASAIPKDPYFLRRKAAEEKVLTPNPKPHTPSHQKF